MQPSFVFDPNRCTGCHACTLACTIENDLSPARSWRRIETLNPRRRPGLATYHLSLACNHCDEPACRDACPALAYARDAATGAVLLDPAKCIGCRYCSWACPYDAPVFDEERGVMTKCTFCVERLQDGGLPACASHCPTGALGLAEIGAGERQNEITGFPRTALGARIRIESLDPARRLPPAEPGGGSLAPALPAPRAFSRVSLRSEWSLLLFTLLSALLVGLALRTVALPRSVDPGVFAASAALALALPTLHLGRKRRVYRAVLNLRRSWLSREIVTITAFVLGATLRMVVRPDDRWLGLAVGALGLLGLYCADRVYGVLRGAPSGFGHSAGLVWTGLFFGGVLSGQAWLAAPAAAVKTWLYIRRSHLVPPWLVGLRVGVGFALPLAGWLVLGAGAHWELLPPLLLGELIDRVEYYRELETDSPAREMAAAEQANG